MNLVERAKSIIFKPKETWEIIKGEQVTIPELFTSYAAILAAIPPIAGFIGLSIIGYNVPFFGHWRQPILNGIFHLVLQYVLSLVGLFVVAFIADALAPSFDSKKNLTGAMKAVVFSNTPFWVISILNIIPGLAFISWIAVIYNLYLLYLGLPMMMETPAEKKMAYFVVVIVVSIVVMFVVSFIAGMALATATMITPGARF